LPYPEFYENPTNYLDADLGQDWRRERRGLHLAGKAVPLQPWSGPEVSKKLRFPDFMTNGTGWW